MESRFKKILQSELLEKRGYGGRRNLCGGKFLYQRMSKGERGIEAGKAGEGQGVEDAIQGLLHRPKERRTGTSITNATLEKDSGRERKKICSKRRKRRQLCNFGGLGRTIS